MVTWVIGVLVVWPLVALGVAVVLGRWIRLADTRSRAERPLTTADLPPRSGRASGARAAEPPDRVTRRPRGPAPHPACR